MQQKHLTLTFNSFFQAESLKLAMTIDIASANKINVYKGDIYQCWAEAFKKLACSFLSTPSHASHRSHIFYNYYILYSNCMANSIWDIQLSTQEIYPALMYLYYDE